MKNTDIEMLEKYKKRIKTQNEAAKENWDMVSCRLPKKTKKRCGTGGAAGVAPHRAGACHSSM